MQKLIIIFTAKNHFLSYQYFHLHSNLDSYLIYINNTPHSIPTSVIIIKHKLVKLKPTKGKINDHKLTISKPTASEEKSKM